MWEVFQRISRGRYPLRIFLTVFATILMVLLAATTLSQTAYADAATRSGDNVLYDGITYQPIGDAAIPDNLPADTDGYFYYDTAMRQIHFLFTSGDPSDSPVAQYVVYEFSPPASFTNPTAPTEVDLEANNPDEQPGSCSNSNLAGIGWIVCPVSTFIANSMDYIYGIIASFLEVNTITSDTDSTAYTLWSIVRDFANIGFVLAFLVIIYSQITSVGISNYGIKHTLPRLIIAAIALNASYWICALAVDATNVLGYSIHNLFTSLHTVLNDGANYDTTTTSWGILTTAILGGAGAVTIAGVAIASAGGLGSAIILLLPVLVMGILAVLIALTVLAARQALIMSLIIISPFAILAYVLPNTEKWFSKWRSALTTLLVFFPIFSLIFSGAQLAGMAIIQTAGNNIITIILGMAVQVAPIVITPMIIKFSSSLIGRIAGIVNNPNKGIVDRTRNWSKGAVEERRNKLYSGQNRLAHLNNKSWNLSQKSSRYMETRRRSREGVRAAYGNLAGATFDGTAKGQAVTDLNRQSDILKGRQENRYTASQRGQLRTIQQGHVDTQKKEIDNRIATSDAGRRLDLRNRRVDTTKQRIDHDSQANWDTLSRTDARYIDIDTALQASAGLAASQKAKLDKVHAEVSAKGDQAEHILNLRGTSPQITSSLRRNAESVRVSGIEASVSATAKVNADRVTAQNLAKTLESNTMQIDGTPILSYTAGIQGKKGEIAVLAKAKSEISATMMEDIKNFEGTMPYSLSTNIDALRAHFDSTDNVVEKIAYAKKLFNSGSPGVSKLRKILTDIGDPSNPNQDVISSDDIETFKEVLASEGAIMASGDDIKLFLTSRKDSAGNLVSFSDISEDVTTWANIAPSDFVHMKDPAQRQALETLKSKQPNTYYKIIEAVRNNPTLRSNVKQGTVDQYNIYSDEELDELQRREGKRRKPGN